MYMHACRIHMYMHVVYICTCMSYTYVHACRIHTYMHVVYICTYMSYYIREFCSHTIFVLPQAALYFEDDELLDPYNFALRSNKVLKMLSYAVAPSMYSLFPGDLSVAAPLLTSVVYSVRRAMSPHTITVSSSACMHDRHSVHA